MNTLSSTQCSIKKSSYLRIYRYGSGCGAKTPRAHPEASLATSCSPAIPVASVSGGVNSQPQASRAGSDIRASALLDTGSATISLRSSCTSTDTFQPTVCTGNVDAPIQERQTVVAHHSHAAPRSVKRTLAEILALSIPALGITLADPVCSLVDTALVGQVSSLELAALSPCTAIFNLAFLVRVSIWKPCYIILAISRFVFLMWPAGLMFYVFSCSSGCD
jgi:hypothetical protein